MIVMFWSRVLIVRLVILNTALRFANFILFSIPSLFSHLLAWAWKVVYGIKLELWFLGGWLPFSLPQSFVVLRWHGRLALVCEVGSMSSKLCGCFSLHFFIVARISSSSHFCHVCHLGLDSVFLRVCSVGLKGCLCIKLELWFFGGWLPFLLPQSFVVLRWHGRLALVYGASYLLAGGWAFGALGMCLPTSC
ncbi:hypothetical protein F2Q69_00036965 [Brassica cretica]|uniref:Transmembrane protein n=1 Tax=Brassica cretica TaxID=69181 RepID=A0A8S9SM83_BRACR|nr:hypothetical protein F2Q69_00036965 [Brassica cretica]